MQGTVTGSVFAQHTHKVDIKRFSKKSFFTGLPKNGTSMNDYNPGIIKILTSPSSATTALGQVWVSYTIELSIPQDSGYVDSFLEENAFTTNTTSGFDNLKVIVPS